MTKLAGVFPAQSEQCRAVKLGVAAVVVIWMRGELLALFVAPFFFCLILAFEVNGSGFKVVLFTGRNGSGLIKKSAARDF
jgi:hypothetical protein